MAFVKFGGVRSAYGASRGVIIRVGKDKQCTFGVDVCEDWLDKDIEERVDLFIDTDTKQVALLQKSGGHLKIRKSATSKSKTVYLSKILQALDIPDGTVIQNCPWSVKDIGFGVCLVLDLSKWKKGIR